MKLITLLTVLMIFSISSWSQTRMQLSFTASPTFNWMNTDNRDVSSEKVVLGYDFGLLGDIYFAQTERYAIQTGLLVLNTGGKLSYRMDAPFTFSGIEMEHDTDIRYRLRYLEVPFSIKLKTDEFHRAFYWGIFGLSGMVNIGARGDSEDAKLRKTSIHDEINLFNIAMNVGLGFDYDLGSSNSASVGVVFQNGLADVTTDHGLLTDKTIINSLKIRLALLF